MNDDVRAAVERLEERLGMLKWAAGLFLTLVTILFTVVAGLQHLGLQAEKEDLRRDFMVLQERVEEKLGLVTEPARLELLNEQNLPLEGREMRVQQTLDEDGDRHLSMPLNVKNSGRDWSGPMQARIYLPEQFVGSHRSDEDQFPALALFDQTDLSPATIPGGETMPYFFRLYEQGARAIPDGGSYEVKIRISYGQGRRTEARFTLTLLELPD